MKWFRDPSLTYPWNILRWVVIALFLLLIVLTVLLYGIKKIRHNANPQGLDRLIKVLQTDILSPQLDELKVQLQIQQEQIAQLQDAYSLFKDQREQSTLSRSARLIHVLVERKNLVLH